ncbi:MAG: hypothetical protein WCL61_03455, partial [bacterium]
AKRIQNKTVLPRRKYNLHKQRNYPSLNELLTGNMIPAVTVMISKTELCGIGGFWQPDGAVLVDHPTWLSLRRIGRFVFIPEILGVFRIHAQQISNVHSAIMNESAISYIEDIVSKLDMTEKKKINMCHVTAELYLRRASLSEEVSNTIRAKIYYRKVLALGNLHQRIAALKRILRLCQDN